jgi:hypothetical protein
MTETAVAIVKAAKHSTFHPTNVAPPVVEAFPNDAQSRVFSPAGGKLTAGDCTLENVTLTIFDNGYGLFNSQFNLTDPGDVWLLYFLQPLDAAGNQINFTIGQHDSPAMTDDSLFQTFGFWFQYDPFFYNIISNWNSSYHC